MALAKQERVEIPLHCVRVPNGKNVYIHYTLRAYRNEKGQPTYERVSIGKLDPETGKLIPNHRYYELLEKQAPLPMPEYVRDYGVFAVFRHIVEELGLDRLLQKHFPGKAEELLTVAQYMLCEGNVMYYLPDWQETKLSFGKAQLSTSAMSRLFAGIDSKSRIDFFNDWIKKRKDQEFIAYDVTSISSYGKGLVNAEWGYNRDKEELPQINLGMYYGEESLLPLYYRIYPGSIPDKAHLKYMAEDTGLLLRKTFSEVWSEFISSQTAKGVSGTMIKNYHQVLHNISRFFDIEMPIAVLTKGSLEEMVVKMRDIFQTIQVNISLNIFSHLQRNGNIFSGVPIIFIHI